MKVAQKADALHHTTEYGKRMREQVHGPLVYVKLEREGGTRSTVLLLVSKQ